MNPSEKPAPIKNFQKVWIGLLVAQFFYALVLFQVGGPQNGTTVEPRWFPNLLDPFEGMISALGAGMVVVALILPGVLARAASKTRSVLEETPEKVSRFFPAFIVRLALVESVCLFGFALGMSKHTPGLIAPFVFVSVAVFAKNFPASPEKVRSDLGV